MQNFSYFRTSANSLNYVSEWSEVFQDTKADIVFKNSANEKIYVKLSPMPDQALKMVKNIIDRVKNSSYMKGHCDDVENETENGILVPFTCLVELYNHKYFDVSSLYAIKPQNDKNQLCLGLPDFLPW